MNDSLDSITVAFTKNAVDWLIDEEPLSSWVREAFPQEVVTERKRSGYASPLNGMIYGVGIYLPRGRKIQCGVFVPDELLTSVPKMRETAIATARQALWEKVLKLADYGSAMAGGELRKNGGILPEALPARKDPPPPIRAPCPRRLVDLGE